MKMTHFLIKKIYFLCHNFSAPPRFRTLTDGFGIHHATVTPETLMLVPPQRFELRPDTLEECCTSVIRKGQIKDDK